MENRRRGMVRTPTPIHLEPRGAVSPSSKSTTATRRCSTSSSTPILQQFDLAALRRLNLADLVRSAVVEHLAATVRGDTPHSVRIDVTDAEVANSYRAAAAAVGAPQTLA